MFGYPGRPSSVSVAFLLLFYKMPHIFSIFVHIGCWYLICNLYFGLFLLLTTKHLYLLELDVNPLLSISFFAFCRFFVFFPWWILVELQNLLESPRCIGWKIWWEDILVLQIFLFFIIALAFCITELIHFLSWCRRFAASIFTSFF